MKFAKITAGLCAGVLAFSGVAGGLPVQEFSLTASAAESGTLGDNLTWTLDDDGVLTISGSGEWDDHAFLANRTFKAAVIEDGVTSIKDTGFGACSEMVSVSISNSVTEIGYGAFFNCSSLRSVTLPDSITCIENTTFSFCTDLAEITIPDSIASIDKEAFSHSGLTEITFPDSVAVIGEEALAYCQSLNSVTFLNPNCEIYDNGLTICNSATATKPRTIVYAGVIRGYAGSTAQAYAEKYGYTFEAIGEAPAIVTSGTCGENLTWTLDDEGTLTISGTGPMNDYPVDVHPEWYDSIVDIQKIVIEDGVTSIGDSAFVNCEIATSITIPESVTRIGEAALYDCKSLTEIMVPDNVISIGNSAFQYCESLTGFTIPDGITSIEDGTFSDCESLTSITISESVKSIAANAFQNCGSVTIKGYAGSYAETYANENNIPFEALDGAETPDTTGLKYNVTDDGVIITGYTDELPAKVAIPAEIDGLSVTSIGQYAFLGCTILTEITIPDSMTSIGYGAFQNCTGLTKITIPDSVTSIKSAAFFSCTSLTEITIPDSVTSIGGSAFYGTPWLDAKREENPLVVVNGILIDGKNCSGSVTIPGSVTSIGAEAFSSCTNLTEITISDSVTSIEDKAFYGCTHLTDITFPDSVTSIGDQAFYDTPWLDAKREENPLVVVNGILFDGRICSGAVTIPDNVTSIRNNAFATCELTEITIPNSVTSIGDYAFYGCTGLTIKGYTGSYAEAFANKNKIPFESLGEAPIPAEPFPDMDGNSEITASDAQVILVAFAELVADNPSGLTPEQEAAADVNGDGKITALDAQYTLTYYLYNSILDDPITWDELLHPNGE